MPTKGRAKVRETFDSYLFRADNGQLDIANYIVSFKFEAGDRVRVTVELLRREAATKKGSK